MTLHLIFSSNIFKEGVKWHRQSSLASKANFDWLLNVVVSTLLLNFMALLKINFALFYLTEFYSIHYFASFTPLFTSLGQYTGHFLLARPSENIVNKCLGRSNVVFEGWEVKWSLRGSESRRLILPKFVHLISILNGLLEGLSQRPKTNVGYNMQEASTETCISIATLCSDSINGVTPICLLSP